MPIDAPTPIRAERREIDFTHCKAPLNPGVLHSQFGFCDAAIRAPNFAQMSLLCPRLSGETSRSGCIRNEAEYHEASKRLGDELKGLDEHRARLKEAGLGDVEVKRVIDPLESFHLQLKEEVGAYERLKRGEFLKMPPRVPPQRVGCRRTLVDIK
jgi:hypothetical protein